MRKSIPIFLLLITISLRAENTPVKLTGTNIGSSSYFEYINYACTSAANTRSNVFDGDLSNTFATCSQSGGWVGLDLGEKKIITKISYCPRQGYPQKMLLGVFEGANNPDFGDAIPLFLIKENPVENKLTEQAIVCSKGFRYVRYIGPADARCNIAEMELYGYSGVGDNSVLPQITNLPTISIHTTNAQDIIEKEVYLKGIVSVISDNGTKIYSDSLEIKGRGNASWGFPKKPYRLKLFNKVSLLGLPATEKNWTLINNYGDKTLMRNLLAFDLSKKLEMPYTPAAKSVDVFLNGEYKGSYQLCDQVEVATGRVVVDKMKITDITLPALAGGYLIEMDAYANQEISWFTSARNYVPVTIKYPKDDEIVPAQSAFIKSYFEKMETALFASDYTDVTNGFRKYIDTETFLRHFLVGEMSGNTDTYWSTYMFKTRSDDKFYFGPVWDFDIAYENDYRTYPINSNPSWTYASTGSTATGVRDIVNRIFSDPAILTQLKSIYAKYRSTGVITENSLLKVIDDNATLLNQSQKLNFMRWSILNTKVHMNPQILFTYEAEVLNVKNFVKDRLKWMDNKLGYITSAVVEHEKSRLYLWSEGQTIHLEGLTGNATIRIIDIAGQLIWSGHAESSYTTRLRQGVYLIHISDDANKNTVLKCIIR